MKSLFCTTFFLCFLFCISFSVSAQFMADVELDIIKTGYNKIQVSGTEGTRFNITDDLNGEFDNKASFAYRLRAGYRFNDRHNVFGLFAPLQVSYNGSFDKNTRFYEENFLPLVDTKVSYQFNSYRLTYRYDFVVTDKVRLGAGLTGKIRDAFIEVEQNGLSSKKTDLGIVPLINEGIYK
ncbi:outer membrane beta-barrel protein [Bernardetia sp. OM2101]|uniref:outer membrane beta-barrel protein n=1 Tax=Bernardetia sp. OM2101 TaxID=3344876 RepID=UPI0035D07447